MTWLRLLGLLFQDVGNDLVRHRVQHLMAAFTLASGLLLAGGGLLAVEVLDRWVGRMESLARITVFAQEGGRLEEAASRLRRDPRFRDVKVVSAEEGSRRFRQLTRESGLMLQSLGPEPIPESLELSLRPDLLTGRRAIEAGESLRELPGVGDVIVDQQRLESMQRTARLLRSALTSLGLFLLLAAGFSTGNVIRMSILSREEEIEIMRLVGASESYIRTPLVLEGAVLGLLASGLAVLLLYGVWWPLNHGFGGLSPVLVEFARLGFFGPRSLLMLGFLGAMTGGLGALWGFWSTRRAQRKMEALREQG